MSPEAQQIAIAEACGFETLYAPLKDSKVWVRREGDMQYRSCPDYLNDLNAAHTAEMSLSDTSPRLDKNGQPEKSDRARFREQLCVVALMNGGPIHATAAQRVEALLRTKGLWVDSV